MSFSALTIETAPAEEPITLAEAKLYLRVTTADQDDVITSLIVAARQKAESITRRALVTQTWKMFMDAFPGIINVPLPELQSITHIKYIDTDGNQQTLSASDYRVDDESEQARITPAYSESWPSIRHITNAIEIQYVAGYGAAADVPDAIKAWMKLYIGNMYCNRAQTIVGTISSELSFVDGLLDDYRVITF